MHFWEPQDPPFQAKVFAQLLPEKQLKGWRINIAVCLTNNNRKYAYTYSPL